VFKSSSQNEDSSNADMKATKFNLLAVISLGSVMALAPMARAQEKTDDAKPKAPQRERAARAPDRSKRIAEELTLTDEQKPKFEAAMKEQTEKIQEIAKNADLSAEDKRAKLREARQDLAARTKKILGAERMENWQTMR